MDGKWRDLDGGKPEAAVYLSSVVADCRLLSDTDTGIVTVGTTTKLLRQRIHTNIHTLVL